MSRAFRIDMNGAQEAPTPNASTATGLGVAVFDDTVAGSPTLDYTIVVRGVDLGNFLIPSAPQTPAVPDNVIDAHFHQQVRGVAGGVVFGWRPADPDDFSITNLHLASGVPVGTVHGTWETTDPVNLNTFAASFTNPALVLGSDTNIYANIHTSGFPGGEIRGQFVLLSTDAGETINGVAGARDDILPGLGGDDIINGLDGNDTLDGGTGNDRVNGGNGNDTMQGGAGNDQLDGGAGADAMNGGADFDYARYNLATAAVVADMFAPVGNSGDAAGDTYTSVEGLIGTNFDDVLAGDTAGNDIAGLAGNDTIDGRDARDGLSGGDGNDTLIGGGGNDTLNGGAGFDLASYATAIVGVVANLSSTSGNTGDATGDVYLSIEGLVGTFYRDTLIGDNNANVLGGADGDDYLQALAGNDVLDGGNGIDMLDGGAGGDVINGSAGFDYARYDYATVGVTADLATPGGNTDDAAGDSYFDVEGLVGSAFNDALRGDGNGNDLAGLAGDDTLNGRGGDDNLQGMGGADFLDGGANMDRLVGGAGFDTFHFLLGEGDGDEVVDFDGAGAAAGDEFVFEGYGAGATFTNFAGNFWYITHAGGIETIELSNGASVDASDYTFI